MPVDHEELMQAIALLARQRNLQVTISQSLKSGVVVGLAATICGLLFGPRGLAVGE